MISVSASISKHSYNPNFKAHLNSVRYVIVDGNVVDDPKITEDVTKQFVKRLKQGNIMDKDLRSTILREMPEYHPMSGTQTVKYLKSYMRGKNFNIIIGEPAYHLKRIWEQAQVSLETKKKQAGQVIGNVLYGKSQKHIALDAISQVIKGKTKYIFKGVFTTV